MLDLVIIWVRVSWHHSSLAAQADTLVDTILIQVCRIIRTQVDAVRQIAPGAGVVTTISRAGRLSGWVSGRGRGGCSCGGGRG